MSAEVESQLQKIPIVRQIVHFLKKIPLSKRTFSLYDLLELYIVGIVKGALTYRASAISYSFFVAIFPFLLVVLNLIPYVPIQNFQLDFWFFIDSMLPAGTHDFFRDIFFDIAGKKRAGLLSGVFVLSLFMTTNGINAIFGGFEYSYHTQTTRSAIRLYLISMGVALILIFLLLLSVILLLGFEVYVVSYLQNLGILQENSTLISLCKTAYFAFVTFTGIAILFRFGTAEKGVRFFSAGVFLTLILIVLSTFLFTIYIENFAQYNQLYGSIGTLLIFILYIWLNSTIVLLGFELNATLLRLKKSE